MPNYWGKQISSLRSFPEVGQKQRTEKERKRPKVGNNNGQLRIAMPHRVAHAKPPGPTNTSGARKPPGSKFKLCLALFEDSVILQLHLCLLGGSAVPR